MYGLVAALALPALLALDLDSPGLVLMAVASVTWAAAAFLCSTGVPVIAGTSVSLNERVSTILSSIAASLAMAGLLVVGAGLIG